MDTQRKIPPSLVNRMKYTEKFTQYPELTEYFQKISFGGGSLPDYHSWRIRWYHAPYVIYTIPGYYIYEVVKQKNVWHKPCHVVLYYRPFTPERLQFKTYKQVHDENIIFTDYGKYRLDFYLDLIHKHQAFHRHGAQSRHLR